MVEGGSDGTKEDCIYRTQLRVTAALLNRGVSAEEVIEKLITRTMQVARDPSEQTRKEQTKQLQALSIAGCARILTRVHGIPRPQHPEIEKIETEKTEAEGPEAEEPEADGAEAKETSKAAPLILMLAEKVWGEASGKWQTQYYFNGNQVVVDLAKSTWFDFENNRGGGLNDLMKQVTIATYKQESGLGDAKKKLLQSSAEFVEDYMPPDYLIDGWLQRRYVYSFTAPTGSGKTAVALRIAIHVALGLPLAGREVEKGHVLLFRRRESRTMYAAAGSSCARIWDMNPTRSTCSSCRSRLTLKSGASRSMKKPTSTAHSAC